jgi:hypothetical protein
VTVAISVAVDPTARKALLILAALLVGSNIGLVGALLFGVVSSARARQARARASALPTLAATDVAPQPLEQAPPSAPGAFVAPAIGSVPALFAFDADMVRDRHRELYEVEYAKQLDRVDTLRRIIGIRLAVGTDPVPPSDEPDA